MKNNEPGKRPKTRHGKKERRPSAGKTQGQYSNKVGNCNGNIRSIGVTRIISELPSDRTRTEAARLDANSGVDSEHGQVNAGSCTKAISDIVPKPTRKSDLDVVPKPYLVCRY